ncbi:hypothetical protein [Ramlibacter sp.]|uniref:hypothetical protein n=1 Tax=Ramlibacter sp. TaxID=1917967 RepID=UPI003D0CAE9C
MSFNGQRKTSRNTKMVGGLMLAIVAAAAVTGSRAPVSITSPAVALENRVQSGQVAGIDAQAGSAAKEAVIAFAEPERPVLSLNPDPYYAKLRDKMRWVDIRMGDNMLKTPDHPSRILLVQAAARRADLKEVGLSYRDVYGIIYSETSWIPRMGASKDGTPNLGIAQFEPATAKALGLHNPEDPVEAVHVAALHLKEAAEWSAKRIAKLKLSEEARATKLREGISIYYNLSTKGRAVWNGLNTAKLPIETRRHIANARRGAAEAADLSAQLAAVRARANAPSLMTVGLN